MKDCGDIPECGSDWCNLNILSHLLTRPSSSPLQDALGRAAASSIRSLYGTTFTVGSICNTICEYFTSLSFYGLSQGNSLCPPHRVSLCLLEAVMTVEKHHQSNVRAECWHKKLICVLH